VAIKRDRPRAPHYPLNPSTRRAIDLHEGSKLNETAFTQLIRAAVAANAAALAQRAARKK